MSQIFHRSANTIARVSIFGAVFFIAGLLGLFAEVNRSPWVTQAHVARERLDQAGVAIRTGQHCAQPVMDRYGIPATARISFGLYNTRADIDAAIPPLHDVRKLFG
jgi:hypothetical protein